METGVKRKKSRAGQNIKRGRLAIEEWQLRARYVLRHLDDPIALQRSPLCHLEALKQLARAKYPNGVVACGRALHDVVQEYLNEIESELDGHAGVMRLKAFVTLTRQGMGVTKSSRALSLSAEYVSRGFKRRLVELLAEKLLLKLHPNSIPKLPQGNTVL